jgi:hypothetical protein
MAGTFAFVSPASAQRSAADIETARQLYNQGIELRDKGDTKGAFEKLKAAHALGNTPITGLELCKMHATVGQPVEAREVCLGVGRLPPLAGETSRSQDARNEAARVAEDMRPKIAVVRLHITGVPQGREPIVMVDGAPVPLAALGEARAVNPGKHDVSARVGTGPETRSQIDLSPGESKDVTLPVTAINEPVVVAGPGSAPGPGYPPGNGGERPPKRERSNPLATAGWVIGGIGVGVGAITGIVALSDKSDLQKSCTNNQCGVADHSALDSAKRWGNVSTTFFVIGGVGLTVGLIATLAAPKSSVAQAPAPKALTLGSSTPKKSSLTVMPDVGPGGVGIHGAF